ncbi:MAG: PEP-CTERM sorting domain-containing protein [Mariniblastus sp.]|nr:PEP-CTERM sorting domain-containing protein [Mariniblastus sp.]
MKTKIAVMIALLAMGTTHQASAAVHGLNVSQMVGQTVESSFGYTFISGWTAAPTYGDGVTMQGAAGASDNLGIAGFVFFEISASDLITFLAGATDGDTFAMRVWNDDNNDTWRGGIWFDENGTRKIADVLENPDSFSSIVQLTMDDISGITKLGLYIENPSMEQGDTYHVSFAAVPEPGTMVIWSMLGGLGLVISRRRKG